MKSMIINPYQQYMYSYPHKTAYGRLTGVNLSDYVDRMAGQRNSLYLHLPFCQYKCGYCNLFSIAGEDRELMRAYVGQMEKQAAQLADVISGAKTAQGLEDGIRFTDLTLGGGTPLWLETALLRQLFQIVSKYFDFDVLSRLVAVETSPRQTSIEKLELLKEYAVNRISIGVQSFQESELDTLHRFHSAKESRQALERIGRYSFDSVNIDIIYGIPGQRKESLLDSLKQAVYYHPEELFVYPLYVKPGTGLYQEGMQTAPEAPALYDAAKEFLQEMGYVRKSMRHFVRRENAGESDNGNLCGFANTVSLGCGGRSYLGNLHFCTPYAVGQEACMEQLMKYLKQEDFLSISHGYLLNNDEMKRRYAVKHLLYGRGICRSDYREHFGGDAEEDFPVLRDWQKKQFVKIGGDWISMTEDGMDLSDYLGPQFISKTVADRMVAWQRDRMAR